MFNLFDLNQDGQDGDEFLNTNKQLFLALSKNPIIKSEIDVCVVGLTLMDSLRPVVVPSCAHVESQNVNETILLLDYSVGDYNISQLHFLESTAMDNIATFLEGKERKDNTVILAHIKTKKEAAVYQEQAIKHQMPMLFFTQDQNLSQAFPHAIYVTPQDNFVDFCKQVFSKIEEVAVLTNQQRCVIL